MQAIQTFFWAKFLLLKCFESATKWINPKHVSGPIQVLKTEDKNGLFGLLWKFIIAFEKFFFGLNVDKYLEKLDGKIRQGLFFYVEIF